MDRVAEHEKRAQDVADSFRRFIVAANTGGIAVTLAVASTLAEQRINPRWAFLPVFIFVIGLVGTGVSLLLAKCRELKRRDAAKANQPEPDFTGMLWRSYTSDTISLVFFVSASIVGLIMLSEINLDP